MSAPGPTLFARFAYPPNALGYCGPDDHGAVLEYAATGVVDQGLRALAEGFEGAWPYLELLAGANGIVDPLDPRVVEAYWIGNALLRGVQLAALGASIEERFRRFAGPDWARIAELVPSGAAHHGFHVLAVGPWTGLLRAGRADAPVQVMDRCRIRVGEVVEAGRSSARVVTRPLAWAGNRLAIGAVRIEEVTAADDGYALAGPLRPGDLVALHWDWVCTRLSPRQAGWLRRCTDAQLAAVNAVLGSSAPDVLGAAT